VRKIEVNKILDLIDEAAPNLLAQYNCPGLALAVISEDDTEFRTFGEANVESAEAVTLETIFQLCSISKSVSAWGVMRLVDEGRLDLDCPVDEYLTRWHLPASDYDNRQVTARRLLSHTAGLPVEGYSGISLDQTLPPIEDVLDGKLPAMDKFQLEYSLKWGFDPETKHEPVRIVHPPGEKFSYSGGGYLLLDLLMEEISGESAADYLDKAVLAPLGMKNSTFHGLQTGTPHWAQPYDENALPLPRYQFIHKSAGGLSADIRDLAQFARCEFNGTAAGQAGRGLITPQSFELMFEPVIFAESAGGMDFDIGLGHFVGSTNGHRLVQHSGGSTGWRSIYFVLPDMNQGFAALVHSSAGNEVWQALAKIWSTAAIR
jgi:CubicO group peptidase (beta-lactamase class C family)